MPWISINDKLPKTETQILFLYVRHEKLWKAYGYLTNDNLNHENRWYDCNREDIPQRIPTVCFWYEEDQLPRVEDALRILELREELGL